MSIFLPTTLPGITFNTTKRPVFSSQVVPTDSGDEHRATIQKRVRWYWKLVYEFVYKNTQGPNYLFSFYAQMAGAYTTFLYRDPTDNLCTVSTGTFLPGPGVLGPTAGYQFARIVSPSWPFVEMLTSGAWNTSFAGDSWSLFVNGTPFNISNVTVGPTGILTFNTGHAPSSGSILTWSGNFYFPVHWQGSTTKGMHGDQFMKYYWQHNVDLESDLQGVLPS